MKTQQNWRMQSCVKQKKKLTVSCLNERVQWDILNGEKGRQFRRRKNVSFADLSMLQSTKEERRISKVTL